MQETQIKICVIGLGYIGLPTSVMFASSGCEVLGVDVNEDVVRALNEGRVLIEEPYLGAMVEQAVRQGRLRAVTEPEEADAFIIAVPTPINPDKTADMGYVRAAAESIVPYVRKGCMVILESTSPPETTAKLIAPIIAKSGLDTGKDLYIAHSPERVLPGRILEELVNNNRVVGGLNRESAEMVAWLYKRFVRGEIYITDATTAEMCKLMENTFRDVNIALANELAMLCEDMGVNAWEVIALSNKHPRVNLHQPGPGVGGHCIAVDPWFIVEKRPQIANIIRLARLTNDSMPARVAARAVSIMGGAAGKICAVLGVTYKPNIDDTRESPIMALIELLSGKGAEVRAYDPHIAGRRDIPFLAGGLNEAARGADLMILAVNHKEFDDLDLPALAALMRSKNLLDARNSVSREKAGLAGLNYYLLGN